MARKSRKNLVAVPTQPKAKGMKLWRAALYIRLSVEFNGKRGDSLETQRQIMEAFLVLYPDIEIVEIYTDNGTTGRTFERPAFGKMLADVETGKIDCIVVKDLSRLGRNTIDTGYYIEKYFPLHHVRFIAVNDQYDSEGADHCGSHIIVPLKNMINEAYAADISKKVKSQAHQSMADGEFIGARPPYGYRKDPENCHKLLVNADTAPTVRQMFEWAADGVALNIIVKRLNESGILTPGHYLASIGIIKNQRLMGSGNWQTWTVTKILADEVYTGDMVQGKTKVVGHKQIPTPPEEWITVRGTHEPLVSRETFETVQSARQQAAERATRAEKVPYTENILRGRIFCGCCGKNLHRQRRHWNGDYFFHCISNDRIAKDACENTFCIEENNLFETILTIIRREAETIMGKNLQIKQKDTKLAAQKADVEKEILKRRQEAASNRSFLISLYENLVTGILTSDEYRTMKAGYEEKLTAAVERMQQLQTQQMELEKQVNTYSSLADTLAEICKDSALTAPLADQLIERITVNGPEDITIRFRFESGFEQVDEVLANE